MPIIRDFAAPANAKALEFPESTDSKLFLAFISSDDPITGQPWCPDVRAALPSINAAFEAENAPSVGIVQVGQKPEWREPKNVYRTNWNINNVPALVRYQRLNGEVSETGRLIEGEILDKKKLQDFLA
ncbi:thioredoxin-like protein [Penicillium argentinense]|uniref:Thioredoxin-like protein n=1 Tax=Penicillium argentinense TaxID=1131581 RepID=A0A9W9EZ23_9EURO|nr:thioredoxin-like protein [Penicillium argentinense]KAJ5090490.1 thioredoxin-like protein [Penicillium argentinense]